jgi:acetyl esterase/lipase
MKLLRKLGIVLGLLLALAAPASATTGVASPNNQVGWPAGGIASAKGWILVIHGGGWKGGADLMQADLAVASVFNSWGYGTWTIDYRTYVTPGDALSWYDTIAGYDQLASYVQSTYGSNAPPICAWGESAGGHLALTLAAIRPLNCVVSQAGPTDLVKFAGETADGVSGQGVFNSVVVPAWSSNPATLAQWSPVTYCPNTRVLMAASTGDQIVPQAQMTDYTTACASTHPQSVLLDGDSSHGTLVGFTHAGITQAASNIWTADLQGFFPH